MVNLNSNSNNRACPGSKGRKSKKGTASPINLLAMCKTAVEIINQLYSPIDAANRFINLALQSLDDDAQSRQFLIESKQGIRKTSHLLKKLNAYTKRIEREIANIPNDSE